VSNITAPRRCSVLTFAIALAFTYLPACERIEPKKTEPPKEQETRSSHQTEEYTLDVKRDRSGRYFARQEAMGTWATLTTAADGDSEASFILIHAAAAIKGVEEAMSTYRPESGISILNSSLGQGEVELPPDTIFVLEEAKRISRLTGGAFDVTYAPLRTLWCEAGKADRLPENSEIARTLASVGSDKLVLTERSARFTFPGMEVDLGGIAKGVAIDQAVEAMSRAGSTSGLVDIGGDMRTLGRRPDGEPWKIEINDPRPGDPPPIRLLLADRAVATSGDYMRTFEIAGKRFSHIVDPRTGQPVKSVPSATVVAPEAITADSLATAISVLGPEEGLDLVEGLEGVECLIMSRGPDGAVTLHWTAGFPALVQGGEESLAGS